MSRNRQKWQHIHSETPIKMVVIGMINRHRTKIQAGILETMISNVIKSLLP